MFEIRTNAPLIESFIAHVLHSVARAALFTDELGRVTGMIARKFTFCKVANTIMFANFTSHLFQENVVIFNIPVFRMHGTSEAVWRMYSGEIIGDQKVKKQRME